jgi:hypothetical protein
MDVEQGKVSTGAITYVDKTVAAVMTPVENLFLISAREVLDFKKITEIFKSGYSRIPVYETDKNDIIGILLVKDLIFVDPDDKTLVKDFIQIFGRHFHTLWPDEKLGEVLKFFKTGKSHMAIVRDVVNTGPEDPYFEIKGVLTLEDIIEEILQDEIHDETDVDTALDKLPGAGFDYSKLRLLDSAKLEYDKLTPAETLAIGAHFLRNVKPFSLLRPEVLSKLESHSDSTSNVSVSVSVVSESVSVSDIAQGQEQRLKEAPSPSYSSTDSKSAPSEKTAVAEVEAEAQADGASQIELASIRPKKVSGLMNFLLEGCPVVEVLRKAKHDGAIESEDIIYRRGEKADFMIMVLTGKLTVLVGKDDFRSDAGPWSVLGTESLRVGLAEDVGGVVSVNSSGKEKDYVPDFTAYVDSHALRYIKISRSNYLKALSGEYAFNSTAALAKPGVSVLKNLEIKTDARRAIVHVPKEAAKSASRAQVGKSSKPIASASTSASASDHYLSIVTNVMHMPTSADSDPKMGEAARL